MFDVQVIEDPEVATVALEPTRARLLSELAVPASAATLGPVASDASKRIDKLSASYLIALGARMVREVGALVRRADEEGKRLATLSIDSEVRFKSAADRAAFSAELTEAIASLVSKYHDESAPNG